MVSFLFVLKKIFVFVDLSGDQPKSDPLPPIKTTTTTAKTEKKLKLKCPTYRFVARNSITCQSLIQKRKQ